MTTIDMRPEWFVHIDKHDISTLDGWTAFVESRRRFAAPPLLTRNDYDNLPAEQRRSYDIARRIGNCNLPKRETPMTAGVRARVEAVLHANLYSMDPGVRSGVFISADGAMGKSTLIREVAADFDADIRDYQRLLPNAVPYRDLWTPVAWVTVPPKLSLKSLGRAILEFYGEYLPQRAHEHEITRSVERVIHDCGTRLLVLDDITRYRDGEADRYAADWIRNLMETSVSVVAMGVDVRGSGILYDGKGRTRDRQLRTQTARRFTLLELGTFRYDTDTDVRAWVSHLRAVENDLLLLDKKPGMLAAELPEFLYEHTQGVIGVLADWIQIATLSVLGRPVRDGGEMLTRTDFEAIPVKAANTDPAPTVTPRSATATPTAPGKSPTSTGRRRRGHNTMYDQPPRTRTKDTA